MDQRCNTLKAHTVEEGIVPGGWGSARLPAHIIAIFQGHLSQQVKDIYSELVGGESIGNWEHNKKIKS